MNRSVITIDPGAAELLHALHAAGYAAYVVGGCVRDSLLGLVPHDWDLCSSARPEQVMALFGEKRCIPTGLQHGTVTVKQSGKLYEITTFRTDGSYSDGRHPDSVQFVPDVRADLARRDFTINAMACNEAEGLVDPFGGQSDLAAHIVRAVGEPAHRFKEDALRILRLYRFAARFGFAVDGATATAARALAPHLELVSAERIREELCRLLCAPKPGAWLEEQVCAVILPELSAAVLDARRRVVDAAPPDLPVRLAALLSPLGEGGARTVLRRLRCSNALTNETAVLIRECALVPEPEPAERCVQARRLLGRLDLPDLRRLTALCAAERPAEAAAFEGLTREGEKQTAQNACCRVSQLAVNGGDLLALGIPAGPQVRKILEALLEQVITGRLPNERKALLDAVLTSPAASGTI